MFQLQIRRFKPPSHLSWLNVWFGSASLRWIHRCSTFSCMEHHGTKRFTVAELQPSSATPWKCSCGRLGSARPTIVMPSSGNITTKYRKSIGSHLPPGHPQLMPIPSRPTLKTLTTSEIDLASEVQKKTHQVDQNGNPWHRGMSTLSNFCRMADHIDISIGKIL